MAHIAEHYTEYHPRWLRQHVSTYWWLRKWSYFAFILREMRRVLRTERGGGTALVVDMVEHARSEYRSLMGHKRLGFSTPEIARQMKAAGFGGVHVHLLPADTEAKGPGLFVATGRLTRANND